MLNITVSNLEQKDRVEINNLVDMIKNQIHMVGELKLTKKDVSMSFPEERIIKDDDKSLIVAIIELPSSESECSLTSQQELTGLLLICFGEILDVDVKGRWIRITIKQFETDDAIFNKIY